MTAALPMLGKAAVGTAIGLGGSLLSKKLAKLPKLTPEGQRAQQGMFNTSGALAGAGNQMMRQGSSLTGQGLTEFNRGAPGLDLAGSYLSKLAGGDAAATQAAIAPQVAQITDLYRGMGKQLDRSGISGANRQIAEAEAARQRAGTIGGLVLAQRPGAVNSLAELSRGRQQAGSDLIRSGIGASSVGADTLRSSAGPLSQIYAGELGRGAQQQQQEGRIGGIFGDFLYDYLRQRGGPTIAGGTMPGGARTFGGLSPHTFIPGQGLGIFPGWSNPR